jgi:hypothetical protein
LSFCILSDIVNFPLELPIFGTTFFSGGIDPGFANDLFPITLLGLCGRVDSVRTTEYIDAGTYPDQESLKMMGLMQPTDQPALRDQANPETGSPKRDRRRTGGRIAGDAAPKPGPPKTSRPFAPSSKSDRQTFATS